MAPVPPTIPTPTVVKSVIDCFDANPENAISEATLSTLWSHYPTNTDLVSVTPKVATLNIVYQTNIRAVPPVAQHIVDLQIDAALNAGRYDIVERIAKVVYPTGPRRNYSFATKYCSWHRPTIYPIYDRRALATLRAYRGIGPFQSFEEEAVAADYGTFVRVVQAFITAYGLIQFSFKEIDKFLWWQNGVFAAAPP